MKEKERPIIYPEGMWMRRERKRHMFSQGDLARHLGVSQARISEYERGFERPSDKRIMAVCKLFSIEPEVLGLDLNEVMKEYGITPINKEEDEKKLLDLTPVTSKTEAQKHILDPSRSVGDLTLNELFAGVSDETGALFKELLKRIFLAENGNSDKYGK